MLRCGFVFVKMQESIDAAEIRSLRVRGWVGGRWRAYLASWSLALVTVWYELQGKTAVGKSPEPTSSGLPYTRLPTLYKHRSSLPYEV